MFYLLRDHLNSSSAIVNQSGDTLTNGNQYYYPYGGNRGSAFLDVTTKRFTGQYHESSLPGGEGLSYYNARWYDPQLGRFLSADTIVPGPANPQAFNRYSYPSGHAPCDNDDCIGYGYCMPKLPWRPAGFRRSRRMIGTVIACDTYAILPSYGILRLL